MTRAGQHRAPADTLLMELVGLGPYFAVAIHDPQSPVTAPWQPLSALTGSPQAWSGRIAGVRAALATAAGRAPEAVEFRVAASVTHLGVAARMISPVLGAAVASSVLLRLDPATARWQPHLGGAFPLSLPSAGGTLASGGGPRQAGALASDLAQHLVNGPVRAVTELTAAMSVSPAVLWGNVASAINGTVSMIATARPGLAARARATGAALLRQPPLAGTFDGAPREGFRRRSCCLIYRIASTPTAAYCADCILLRPRGRSGIRSRDGARQGPR